MLRVGDSTVAKSRISLNARRNIIGYIFVLPALLVFIVFVVLPLIIAVYLSFFKTNMFFHNMEYVGLWNFADLLSDTVFRKSLVNILYFVALSVPANVILSMMMALLLNSSMRGKTVYRVLFYLPAVTSSIVASLVWMWLMKENGGLLNKILGAVGIPASKWLGSSKTSMLSIAIISVWQGTGANMLIFLAALQGLPIDVYESAKLDGAGAVRRFVSLTIPFLAPTIFFIVTMALIGAFQLYDQVKVLTNGGPSNSTVTPVYLIWQNAFSGDTPTMAGYAAAQSFVLFVIIMIVTVFVRLGMRFINKAA